MTTMTHRGRGARAATTARRRPVRSLLARLRHEPVLCLAGGALLLLALLAILGPMLWSQPSSGLNLASTLRGPSATHPMGTDDLGRDVFARFLDGARLSLLVGVAVTGCGAVIGGAVGVLAGMASVRFDGLLNWLINTLLAFPPLMLAMAVSVALGADVLSGSIGLVIAAVPWFARVLRSEVIRIRSLPAAESAVVLGASRFRIAYRHVVPHLLPTLVIQAAASFGWSILTLAALGFVGLGAQPPTAEWGSMITGGLQYALTGQWWIGVFPGLGLILAVAAATALADRARDVLDPRGKYARI